ncbi:class A beta-lactamase Bla1 [soil metagenome]
MSLTRRHLLLASVSGAALLLAGCASPKTSSSTTQPPATPSPATPAPAIDYAPLVALEATFAARIGVYALDTATGRTVSYRAGERFAFCSSSKALLAAAVLQQRFDELDNLVRYTRGDLVTNSPVTALHVGIGMTLRELCDAALRFSDNTAANLLFRELGGPSKLTEFARSIGDTVTRSDRNETELNTAVPGDPRDTSTPRALGRDIRNLLVGDTLDAERRAVLTDWMTGNATTATLIRAGVPSGWTVTDKSGAGGYGTRNDVGIATPAEGKPVVLAIMSTHAEAEAVYADALIAQATTIALGMIGH